MPRLESQEPSQHEDHLGQPGPLRPQDLTQPRPGPQPRERPRIGRELLEPPP